MNDFTKEELLIILLDFESVNPNPTRKVHATINKIKSMIDNYCEHEDLKDVGEKYKVCRLCGEEVYD